MDPIINRIKQAPKIEKNGKAMRKHEKIDHKIQDLELILIDDRKLDNAEILIIFSCLQVQMDLD